MIGYWIYGRSYGNIFHIRGTVEDKARELNTYINIYIYIIYVYTINGI